MLYARRRKTFLELIFRCDSARAASTKVFASVLRFRDARARSIKRFWQRFAIRKCARRARSARKKLLPSAARVFSNRKTLAKSFSAPCARVFASNTAADKCFSALRACFRAEKRVEKRFAMLSDGLTLLSYGFVMFSNGFAVLSYGFAVFPWLCYAFLWFC